MAQGKATKTTLHSSPCFKIHAALVDPESGRPSPITSDIQALMHAYQATPDAAKGRMLTPKEALVRAVQEKLAEVASEHAAVKKLVDDHAAKIDRRHTDIPVTIDHRLPHEGDVIVEKEKAALTSGDLKADHPDIQKWEKTRRETERAPDATTGLIDRRHHDPTLERAYKLAQESSDPVSYADFDIANQGGLNEHMGADALADPHLKGMVQVVQKVVLENHPGAQVMRKGGDEYAVFAPGVTAAELEKTLAKAKEEVHAYTVEHGLDKISRKRPETDPYGTGIHYGVVDLKDYESATKARETADSLTEIDKQKRKEAHYVNLKQTSQTRTVAPGEQSTEGNNSSTGSSNIEEQKADPAEWWNGLKRSEQGKALRAVGSSLGTGVEWDFIPPEVQNNLIKKKESSTVKTVGQRPAPPVKRLDPSKDGILAAIALKGGLNTDNASNQWGKLATDAANDKRPGKSSTSLSDKKPYDEIFNTPIFRKTGGLDVDAMAELLAEDGYLSRDENGKHELAELEEKISAALSGQDVFSHYNQKAGESRYEAEYAAMLEQLAAEEADNLKAEQEEANADLARIKNEADEVSAGDQSEVAAGSTGPQEAEGRGEVTEYDPFDDPFSTDEEKAAFLDGKNNSVSEQFSLFGSNQLDLDFREGTTDAEKQRATELLDGLIGSTQENGRPGTGDVLPDPAGELGVRRSSVSLLANAISTAFRTKGVFNFTGQQINSAGDLAAIAQVYRNPSFETLRYFFTKDNVIVGHTGVSSRMPGVALALPTSAAMPPGEWVKAQLDHYGADGFWMVHNHPSGNVAASGADLDITKKLAEEVSGFRGHVIINHNKFGMIKAPLQGGNATFSETTHVFSDAENSIHNPSVPHPLIGKKVMDAGALVQTAYELQIRDGHFLVIGVRGKEGISGLIEIPVNTPKIKIAYQLRKFSLQTGSQALFAVLPHDTNRNLPKEKLDELKAWAREAHANGFLTEAVDEHGFTVYDAPKNGNAFGRPLKGYEVSRTEAEQSTALATQKKAHNPELVAYWNNKAAADKLSNIADDSGKQTDHAAAERAHAKMAESHAGSSYAKYHEDMRDYHKGLASTDIASQPEKMPPAKLDDFGEKIGGARKDYAAKFEAANNLNLATEPFSKTWPEPDYNKLLESGLDSTRIDVLRAIRDEIPDKPRQEWKLKSWVNLVESLRGHAGFMLYGDSPAVQRTLEMLKDSNSAATNISARAELYKAVGHDVSLRGVTLSKNHYTVYRGEKNVTKWQIEQKQKATIFSNMPRELGVGNTKEEAIADFKNKIGQLVPETSGKKPTAFIVYSRRGQEGFIVGKKMGKDHVDIQTFPTAREAHGYIKENRADLEAKLSGMKDVPFERNDSNTERSGNDVRGGKDATPETFLSSFGFRGVEFGNSMPAGERQANLNQTFDALHDMAGILGIPTQAISLNGELALAFGARGHGGKQAPAAHYEPGKIVINLTRNNGPGSLAHEWFHAIDNYLSRQRNYKNEYITNSPVKYGPNDSTRPELIDAFKKLNGALNDTNLRMRSRNLDKTRSKDYWSTGIEMHARAFENYVIDKLAGDDKSNDYLANVKGVSLYAEDLIKGFMEGKTVDDLYPYLLPNEIEKVSAAFDNLFATMKTRQTEQGVAVYENQDGYGQTTSAPFKKWFGESKVVAPDGSPAIVYHGTNDKFTTINFKKGAQGLFWFTSDKNSITSGEAGAQGTKNVMGLYAKIENPAGWKEYDKYSTDELEHLGYDGVILRNNDGSFDGFVFKDPTQIKSATGNNGNFNINNKSIIKDTSDGYSPITSSKEYNDYLDRAEKLLDAGNVDEAVLLMDKAAAMHIVQAIVKKQSTGVKNAITEEEGGEQDKWKFTREGIFEEGKRLLNDGTVNPRQLVHDILADPKKLITAEEQASLLYDRMRLHNEHAAMTEKLIAAKTANDDTAFTQAVLHRDQIEQDLANNAQAVTYIGTSWAAFGHARQAVMAEDYSLSWTLQRVRAATGKADIPEEVRKKLEDLTKQLEIAEAKAAEYEAKLKDADANRKVKVVVERIRTTVRPAQKGSSRREVDAEFKGLSSQLHKLLSRSNMNVMLDPEVIKILGLMARNRIVAGTKNPDEIIDDIHADISDLGLEKRDIRDAISGYGKTSKLTMEEINVDLREARRQMRLISALEDADSGQAPLKSGMQRDPVSDEVRELQRQIKDAMREMGVDATSTRSPEDQWKTAIDGIKTRLRNEIYDLDKQIGAGKRTIKDRNTVDYDEEAKQLKIIRDGKKALLDEIAAKPPKSEEELQKIGLKAYKTRTAARILELQKKLDTGNFEKKARRVLQMDDEAIKLRNEAEAAKSKVDHAVRELELANRTTFEKSLDWTKKWRRAIILSGTPTVIKLSAAASMRMVITPMEEMIGGILGVIPGLSTISKEAPREGGLNLRAEAAAFGQWFEKQSYRDIKDVATTGTGTLDRLYGHKHDSPPELIEFFGRIHGALKVLPKRAEFYRSLQKRTEHAIANGVDITEPAAQTVLTAAAYIDANRAIFMNENAIVAAHRMAINSLRRSGTFGNVIATMIEVDMPIVKIPTNFVGEVFSYAPGGGLAKAAAKAYFTRGQRTADDADYIMRALKKQGVGMIFLAAVMAMVMDGILQVGGYFEMGEKRELEDAKAGTAKFAGHAIPKLLLHTPLLEVPQMAATYQRTQKHYAEWNENPRHENNQKENAVRDGIVNAAAGLIEELPFISTSLQTFTALKSAKGRDEWVGNFIESMIMPPDLRRWSRGSDKAGEEQIPRKADSLGKKIQASIPGFRQELPIDVEKFKRMPYSRAKEIMDNAPAEVQDELYPAFIAKEQRYFKYGLMH